MNHKNTTLAVAAIIAAAALTGVAFAIPQQVMAGGSGHRHHNYNNHNGNGIRVDQQVNQLNACSGTSSPSGTAPLAATSNSSQPDQASQALGGSDNSGSTTCLNFGENNANIHR